jgi:hypothetical protein
MKLSMPALAMALGAGTSCNGPEPVVQAKVIQGPNSQTVAALIAAVDSSDTRTVNELLGSAKFTEGEFGKEPQTRPIRISDIPHARQGLCDLEYIQGAEDTVRADWECRASDLLLSRDFIFRGAKIAEVKNIYMVLP